MRYIDSEKLIAEIERRIDSWSTREKHAPVGQGKDTCTSRVTELSDLLSFVTSLQQEQPDQTECVWIHKKYNREYRIVSDNARLKDSDGKWIDCVIYAPLYENEFEMFAREKDSFYKEFEKK